MLTDVVGIPVVRVESLKSFHQLLHGRLVDEHAGLAFLNGIQEAARTVGNHGLAASTRF